ncbi:LLM class flavin-dependent oxidoreductase [Streptomyces sp. NPDC058701]|uniref:LLM class flavin-dependent oxidoreductase n=1 Tax=Streptomyces sp. NPDC058701 TaxID=3346608 RepID=UPI0036594927
MTGRPLLALGLDGVATGPETVTGAFWTRMIGLAAHAGVDFVTMDDSMARPASSGPQPLPGGRLDAISLLAYAAPSVFGLGLVAAVTTTYTEPFHVSAGLATLDHISGGWAGWLIRPSVRAAEARHFGRAAAPSRQEAWIEAGEVADTVVDLWDSWQDGAEIRDRATGCFLNADLLHPPGPHGRFHVQGPSITPRPPQGRPVIVVALDTDPCAAQLATAARCADVVLLPATDLVSGRELCAGLRGRAAAHGRHPDHLKVLTRLVVGTAGSGPGVHGPARGVGDVGDLALGLEDWYGLGGADGVHVSLDAPSDELPALAGEVLPLLAASNIPAPTGEPAGMLRTRLGLPRVDGRRHPSIEEGR